MEHKQVIGYQLDIFVESQMNTISPSAPGEEVNGSGSVKDKQVDRAMVEGRALAGTLMRAICSHGNLLKAYRRVKKNKGVAGVDEMPVGKFSEWYAKEGVHLITQLLRGDYRPSAVKSVQIRKPGGGYRQLGIPTVTDRILQQAISQVLTSIYEPQFSEQSYGFRPNRNTHQALRQAGSYVKEGRKVVVDMDIASFFDEVNHDRLMYRLSKDIGDKVLLQLIRKYLRSGIMLGGLTSQREKGTPQGSPLSPLLSNVVLDELDKELERRGHSFVRYADDVSIYVHSQRAGDRVLASISTYLTRQLKLKVSEAKSKVCQSHRTTLLGYTVLISGELSISSMAIDRLKLKVKRITSRRRGVSLLQVVQELNPVLRGWYHYFKHARCLRNLEELDGWIRRKLRCFRLKQCKRVIGVYRFLRKRGTGKVQSWLLALSGKGWWCKSRSPQAHHAMGSDWFEELKLFNMHTHYKLFKQLSETA